MKRPKCSTVQLNEQAVVRAVLLACTVAGTASCAMSQNQASDPARARAMCELRALESVGYQPSANDYYYPRNLEAAKARLRAKQGAQGVDTCAPAVASPASVASPP